MTPSRILIILFAFAFCTTISAKSEAKFVSKEKEILDGIIGPDSNYDGRIRPNGINETGGPVVTYISLYIRHIESVSDVNMEYTVQLTLQEKWNDNRLAFERPEGVGVLTLAETGSLWMPDLYFKNEKKGHFHNVILPNQYIKIFPNGDVLYSTRITLTLSCPMNLAMFPHDRQECLLNMGSYSRTMNDIVFLWRSDGPVRFPASLHLPKFTLESFKTEYCNGKTSAGEYSCLQMSLLFRRVLQSYLVLYYIPCCMLVIASWISFWLHTDATTARAALGITILLTMCMQVASLNQTLSPVSYTKAIDVWTGVCLTFVFGALLEFAAVNVLSTREDRGLKKNKSIEEPNNEIEMKQQSEEVEKSTSERVETNPGTGDSKKNLVTRWLARYPSMSKKVDVISRIAFPIAFAIFNLAYWCTYLPRAGLPIN